MPADAIGVPVHWLDGGLEDHPTLVANNYAEFYGPIWVNTDYGAKVTGNSTHFEDYEMVLTGCDASGAAHPNFPLGAASDMDDKYMVAVGTPKGRSLKTREDGKDPNFAPLGAVDVDEGYAYHQVLRRHRRRKAKKAAAALRDFARLHGRRRDGG